MSITLTRPTTDLTLRPGRPEDASACGVICYEAFAKISAHHNFPPDFPSIESATNLMTQILVHERAWSVIAERDGRIVGSNFLWQDGHIAGVGPITVDPAVQNGAIGRRLMEAVLERAKSTNAAGVRLVQAGFHCRSLSLYTKLGFDVREPLACMQGDSLQLTFPGRTVRTGTTDDFEPCNDLCRTIHGHDRSAELSEAIGRGSATVVEHAGRIRGYTTSIGFFSHAVAETNEDLAALIGAAERFEGPGFLLPMRNAELFRWCLRQGLRVVQPLNLMAMGLYNEPRESFLPSVLY